MMRCLIFATLAVACAGGPRERVSHFVDQGSIADALAAYEVVHLTEGGDPGLLARVATGLLEREARNEDEARRRAALLQLSLAGTAGEAGLRRIAEGSDADIVRVGALVALARRGDMTSRYVLRSLADRREPSLLAAATVGMDAEADQALLLALLSSVHPTVRAAAARGLRGSARAPEVFEALCGSARSDDDASVRGDAVAALGGAGARAIGPLLERLSDPSSSVRFRAVGAVVAAAPRAGAEALRPWFDAAPSPTGIEAARQLAATLPGTEDGVRARAFLHAALRAPNARLRGQAGVAIAGIRGSGGSDRALREALRRETDRAATLALARALLTTDERAALDALERLVHGGDLPATQAAALLAERGGEEARHVLMRTLSSAGPSLVRRTAARALARRAGAPELTRSALVDDDPWVRIFAAGGILSASVQ